MKIAIIIVAAGASSRMKISKQLLPLGGTTILGKAIEQAKKADAVEVFTVLGCNFENIKSEINHLPTTIVENRHWENGLGSSIAAGVNFILQNRKNIKAIIIMLGDQPLINSSFLNELINLWEQNREFPVATKYSQSKGVPAIFPKDYFEALGSLSDDFGAKFLLNGNNTVLTVEGGTKIIDVDTPEDYEAIKKKFS